MHKYIAENVIYLQEAKDKGISGTLFVRFQVKKNDMVGIIQIQRGIHPLLDNEAIRVIKTLKKFEPEMQQGKPVNVWFSVPVNFY